ncbi:MAG: dienelactone hydrolase family protein [Deltaproteobacteria bacterium]|nr:dienelactone hydrolase family protein [Deltaproteobacteria bacterium]
MTTQVEFSTQAGTRIAGALAEPPGAGKVGAVVVIHEWHGLNEVMKLHCEQFAQAGFVAFAPDLFHGKLAADDDEAAKLIAEFDFQRAVGDIGETVAYARAHVRCNGRVAVVGFCLGGALTLAAARFVPGLDAAVPFYGLPRLPADAFVGMATPVCGHYARVDEWADPAVAEQIQGKVRGGGGEMEVHVYDAGHAFMRSTDASRHEPKSAALAWQRTLEFLRTHLG